MRRLSVTDDGGRVYARGTAVEVVRDLLVLLAPDERVQAARDLERLGVLRLYTADVAPAGPFVVDGASADDVTGGDWGDDDVIELGWAAGVGDEVPTEVLPAAPWPENGAGPVS